MRTDKISEKPPGNPPASEPPVVAIGAAVFAVLLAAGGLLWARYGEAVYLDRIFSAIANCF